MTKRRNNRLTYEVHKSIKHLEELIKTLQNSLEEYRRKVTRFLLSEDVVDSKE